MSSTSGSVATGASDAAGPTTSGPPAKPGTILKLMVTNFMSHKEAVMVPGPGFNVVIGPNGSGKSTLVSAITLGLGGDVGTLGRQKNFAEFVNNRDRNKKAEIKILLSRDGSRGTYLIACEISASGGHRGGGTVAYLINEKHVQPVEVRNASVKVSTPAT